MKTQVEAERVVGTSKRILIVEDEPPIQDVLQFALKGAGYEVLLAHDGQEALEHMQTVIPDLILLDLMMPGMNGFRFINELDLRGMRSAIPIIVISALANVEELKQMHICAYLPKPFSMKTLLEEVQQCVRCPLPRASNG
jgi:two-component system response regulator VicR